MKTCNRKTAKKIDRRINSYSVTNRKNEIEDINKKLKTATNENKKKELIIKKKQIIEMLYVQQHRAPGYKNRDIEETKETFCNPGCVDTWFQEAEYSQEDLEKKYNLCENKPRCNKKEKEENRKIITYFKKSRKQMLKGHKTMLNDDFYHAFDKKMKAKLIKDGALSGCIGEL